VRIEIFPSPEGILSEKYYQNAKTGPIPIDRECRETSFEHANLGPIFENF